MRELIICDDFVTGLGSLSTELKKQALRRIRFLAENPAHPSLNAHKLQRVDGNYWECYITMSHRLIYEPLSDEIRLWRIGDHQLVDRVHLLSFSPHTPFRRLDGDEEPIVPAETPFEAPAEWSHPIADQSSPNPFADFPPSHLRILGVPSPLVKTVRTAPSVEHLMQIPGLPEHTVNWLLELATNPELEEQIYNPGRLIFRATLDQLEGYIEGKIKRLMLNLSDEQQKYVELDLPGVTLIRGCAGSGKTTIAIYRAIRHALTGEKVLFLTFNKTLATVSRTLIQELSGPLPDNLHVTHLDGLLRHVLGDRGSIPEIVETPEQKILIKQAISGVSKENRSYVLNFPWYFFKDEIERVIKGNGLHTEADYLAIPRYGRQTALKPPARAAVWAVYQTYQALLQQKNKIDWSDLTLLAYRELLKQPLIEPYDHVVVDEIQDLSAMQLRVIQRLNKGGATVANRTLFLVGDVAQTIYSRGYTWKHAGLQVQGHSYSVRRNFRNTRQIAEAAAVLNNYNRRIKFSEDFVDPEFTRRQGPWPIVLDCDLTSREQRAVTDKILSLVEDQRFRVQDFAVLCPTTELCRDFRRAFAQIHLPSTIYTDTEFDVLEEQIKILTIHSAKGLEFPIVFLTGLHNGILPRRLSKTGDDEEAGLEFERNRTLLYVGMTRAAEALYLVTSHESPSAFLSEIATVTRNEPFSGGNP